MKYHLILLVALASLTAHAQVAPGLTPDQVRNFVTNWYEGTNDHKPVGQLLDMLADDVEMLYPNRPEPFTGKEAFRKWYDDVLQQFFDETHKVEAIDITLLDSNHAEARVTVRWERRSWPVGEAKSKYDASLSHQRFEIARSPDNGRVFIRKKIVETFEPTAPIFGLSQ
jgi:ketosteroid isomerase-like protein